MYEEFNKPIQELMKLMAKRYPHDFELVISSFGADIQSTHTYMNFINEDAIQEMKENFNFEEAKEMFNKAISSPPLK